MHIKRFLLAGLVLAAGVSSADAGVRIGIGVGIGFPAYGPYYRPYYGYPYPYYYAPPAVVVAPAPVVAAPVVVGSAPAPAVAAPTAVAADQTPAPPLAPVPAPTVRAVSGTGHHQADLSALNDPNVKVRADACIRLGHKKVMRAVPTLTRTLREDGSPTVREAAARALGLIGSPSSLSALQAAAQGDDDRDVRRSASFAAEVIRGNMRR